MEAEKAIKGVNLISGNEHTITKEVNEFLSERKTESWFLFNYNYDEDLKKYHLFFVRY